MSALERQTGWLLRALDLSVSDGNGVVALQPARLDLAPGACNMNPCRPGA